MTAPEPDRATEMVREIEWADVPWRVGLALNPDGKIYRVTLDPDPAVDLPDELLRAARSGFVFLSLQLPKPHDELRAIAGEVPGTALEAAIGELIAVEAEFGDDYRAEEALRHDAGAHP